MMQKAVFLLLLTLSLLPAAGARPARSEYKMTQISTADGLSQNTVRDICIDRRGFVWFATLGGLNRYDGTNFAVYHPQLGNRHSLSDIRIKSIDEDPAGCLWIKKYDNSFSCYNPLTDSFVDVVDQQGNVLELPFTEIHMASDSSLMLYGQNGAACIETVRRSAPTAVFYDRKEKYLDLAEDRNGNLWLCGTTLTRVRANGKAKKYDMNNGPANLRSIAVQGGYLLMTVIDTNRLFRFDLRNDVPLEPAQAMPDVRLIDCCAAGRRLLVGTRAHGMMAYDVAADRFEYDVWGGQIKNEANFITDNRGGVWIYDHSGLIYHYNPDTDRPDAMRLMPSDFASVVDNERYTVFVDSRGSYWLTTYGSGLVHCDADGTVRETFRFDGTPDGLSSDYLLSVAEDDYGNIWVGSDYAGAVRLSPQKSRATRLRPEQAERAGVVNNVRMVYEDARGNIWLSTKNGSLYVYDVTLQHLLYSRKSFSAYTIAADTEGRLWIGTKGGGIYLYDPERFVELAHFVSSTDNRHSLCHNDVFSIRCDTRGRIWIATFGGGLDLAVPSADGFIFRHFFADSRSFSYLRNISQDSKGNIWIASYDGLLRFDPDRLIADPDDYVAYSYDPDDVDGLSCKDIKSVCEDASHRIWLATAGGGLNMLPASGSGSISKFTTHSGLNSNLVTSLLCSDDSTIWIGTENGLARLNLRTLVIDQVDIDEGFNGNYFSENACIRRSNGHLVFGTLDGIVEFDPEDMYEPERMPAPVLTRLTVDGSAVDCHAPDSPTAGLSMTCAASIGLSYAENTFSISFASLNLTNSPRHKYCYILEGFDTHWSTPSTDNVATYKKLPSGTYTFRVRNAADGPERSTSVSVTIRPPWWRTTLAMVIYALVFLLLLGASLMIVTKVNSLRTNIRMEHALTDYKLRFFTNISHEFRTPLTLIRGTVQSLTDETRGLSDEAKAHIDILVRNTQHLSRLIDQLLEFRKIQNKVLTLNLERTNIAGYVSDICNTFSDLARQKRIDFAVETPDTRWEILIDRSKVEKIVYNYILNAFKFTPEGGRIVVSVSRTPDDHCLISVTDNGCGIPKSKQANLFARFMQVNFSAAGSGVGLSLVKEFAEAHHGRALYAEAPGGGSTFSVELPTDYSNCADVNIVEQQSLFAAPEADADADSDLDTVLVIDDNEDIRNFLRDKLSSQYRVLLASDGKEGFETASHQAPDLIVSDVKMPQMDGIELTQRIRANFVTAHIPIILLTAHPSDSLRLESSESGADEYIMKPFDFKYLLSRIGKLIEQRAMLRRRFADHPAGDEAEAGNPNTEFIETLNSIISQNAPRSDFKLEDLADELHMSRSSIYKKIRAVTGCAPGEYVKMMRMNMAARLLRQGDLTVAEVSWKVGIEDQFYFSKCFKKHFGCSPSMFAKSQTR